MGQGRLGKLFFSVTPGSRAGPQIALSRLAWWAVSWLPRARPSGTSPGGRSWIEAITWAPGSGREPNGSLSNSLVW
jgi:hypothetical protein